MRILFSPAHYVFDATSRGSELTWVFNIVNSLATIFPKSVVITGFSDNISNSTVYKIIEITKRSAINLSILNSLLFNLAYTIKSIQLLRRTAFDVHYHVMPFIVGRTFLLQYLIFKKHSWRLVIGPVQFPIDRYWDTMSDTDSFRSNRTVIAIERGIIQLCNRLLMMLSIKSLRHADKIVSISSEDKRKLIELGLSSNRIVVITPGVDTKTFKPVNSQSSKVVRAVTVSNLVDRKRLDLLIEAINILNKTAHSKRFLLDIIGSGPRHSLLRHQIQSLKLENSITLIGRIPHEQINRYYNKSDIFVTMSENETWGQMYLEAISSGLPVVSARNNGASMIIKKGMGFLVDSPSEMAESISKYFDTELLLAHKKNCRDEALRNYDWQQVIIPKYLDLFVEKK